MTLCESAAQAIDLYRAHRYDLVLLDLHMPGMDGYEVMAALKAMEPDGYLPVLVITADPEAKTAACAREPRISSASPSIERSS